MILGVFDIKCSRDAALFVRRRPKYMI